MNAFKRLRSVSLRSRIALLTAGAVAVAVVGVSVAAWVLVRGQLRNQVDAGLERRAGIVMHMPGPGDLVGGGPDGGGGRIEFPFGLDNALQIIDGQGRLVLAASRSQQLPITDRDKAVASGTGPAYMRDARIGGVHLRVITAPLEQGRAIQIARALTEVDGTLRGFAIVLIVLAGIGVAGAAGVGLLIARSSLGPVERLTAAAEHVARTKELDAAIEVERDDELGRLARSFNEMLTALSQSREQQQQLVADASHELRTPLTSIRTNIEVLGRQADMEPAERDRLLGDLRSEVEELSALVGELVELATEVRGADDEEMTDVRLDQVVSEAADRAQRRSGRTISVDATESVVFGRPVALDRAVSNVIDNATKWGPESEPIDVTVRAGRLEVRDRGPGIPVEDRPHVFDRFYRATAARSMPGSGLGLSIVRQIVEAHGGRVWAEQADGPGAIVGFELPEHVAADEPASSADS